MVDAEKHRLQDIREEKRHRALEIMQHNAAEDQLLRDRPDQDPVKIDQRARFVKARELHQLLVLLQRSRYELLRSHYHDLAEELETDHKNQDPEQRTDGEMPSPEDRPVVLPEDEKEP